MSNKYNSKVVAAVAVLVLFSIATSMYFGKISGSVVQPQPFMISNLVPDIDGDNGQGRAKYNVGAFLTPYRVCQDDSGNSYEMYISIYGGDYPYGDRDYRDYDYPENNDDIQFGSIRVTSANPDFQGYFDRLGTENKKWPVWVEFKCGASAPLTIRSGDKLVLRYDTGGELYVNLPDMQGQNSKTLFISDTGAAYDGPLLSGESLAPKVCTDTDGGIDFFKKGTCSGDLVHNDECKGYRDLREWYCGDDGMCYISDENCEQKYGTECRDGKCLVCTPDSKQCEGSKLRTCKSDGSAWAYKECEFGCNSLNGVYTCRTCVPGTKQCDGNGVKTCNENGYSWSAAQNCASGATCQNGACVSSQTRESAKQSVSCDFSWPQKVVVGKTWIPCTYTRPYCNYPKAQQGIAECCKYDLKTKIYSNCQSVSARRRI